MALKAKCIVTESLVDKGAFAVRCDNDEQVYIPKSIAEKLQLEEFDEILAIIAANTIRPDATPWFAMKVKRLTEDEPEDA